MENTGISFKEQRNFSGIINATFTFIAQELKMFVKTFLYLAGPLLLLGTMFLALSQINIFSIIENDDLTGSIGGFIPLIILYFLGIVFQFLGVVAVNNVVSCYIKVYNNQGKKNLTVDDVWKEFKANYFRLLLSHFLLSIIFMVLGVVGILFLGLPYIYVLIATVFIFPIQVHERKGFIDAFRRSFYLIKDKWFMTIRLLVLVVIVFYIIFFGIIFFGSIIVSISSAFSPEAGSIWLIKFSAIFYTVISVFLVAILYSVMNILVNFQYFNMIEQKEFPSLIKEIDKINA